MHPELYIVQSITSWITIINAKPVFFVHQEMEFLIGSTLPVNSCKIVSISYTSRAIHCALYLPLEFYINIINTKSVLLIIPYLCGTGNRFSTWYQTCSKIMQNIQSLIGAKHCALYYLLISITLLSIQSQFYSVLQMCNRK